MDATLQIIIRAQARQAQAAIGQTAAQLNALQRAANSVNHAKFMGFFDLLASNKLIKAGKNLQWVGHQLVYNITLPLGLAGVALFRFVQGVEKELTQLRKVYGDVGDDQAELRKETDALAESFKLLSSYFGVNQAEVAKIGAIWAQAGSAGRGLAENVKATLEAMILGDMEAEKATESLIAIQGTWRLSTKKNEKGISDLHVALAQLNIIENQTGINMEGLIDVYVRAGGTARTAGMQFEELGAFAAALVPATGSAAQAGNALKTIISRLQAPTKDTIEVLERMGITVTDPSWLGATATEKIVMMAEQFGQLSQANKNFVSSIIASRWQVNRFNVLMDDVGSGTGYFAKALKAASDETQALDTYNRELQTVLQSSPRRWAIMTATMQNALADAFIPLLPAIFEVMRMLTKLAQAFADLNPNTQRWIAFIAAGAVLVGPILVLISAFSELLAVLWVITRFLVGNFFVALYRVGQILGYLAVKSIPLVVSALWQMSTAMVAVSRIAVVMMIRSFMSLILWMGSVLLPAFTVAGTSISVSLFSVVAVIAAIVLAIMLILNDDLRDGVWDVIKSIGRAFAALPEVIVDVMNTIIRVLAEGMSQAAELLSYLNPFARHSPSLVDNVKAGVSTILDEYSRLSKISPLIRNSINALNDFGMANSGLSAGRREAELREKAAQPGVQGGDQIVNSILALEAEMPNLTREIASQKMVVAQWSAALKVADDELEILEDQLAASEKALESITDKIDTARAEIDRLANMPITGMRAFEDQLFDNEMATKSLQLQMLEFEKAGTTIDEIREKFSLLNGEIEMLQGERENLRLAGAGSDILKTYDDQIAAIQAQKGELADTQDEIEGIQDQLDALDLERRFLELTRSLTFDPLVRSIDQIVNGVAEMDYDNIVAAIKTQQEIIAALLPEQERLTEQVKAETAATDAARAAREAISDQLEIEQQKLDALEQAYSDINGLIREMESLLSDVSQAAKDEAEKARGFIDEMFDAGLGVDYPIVGTDDILDREGTLADIEAFNKEMEELLKDMLGDMGIGDLFAPFKQQWDRFKAWVDNWWQKVKDGWNKSIEWLKDKWELFALGLAVFMSGGLVLLLATIIHFGPIVVGWINDNIIQPIIGFFEDLWIRANEIWSAIWDAIRITWETVGVPALTTVQAAFSGFMGFLFFVFGIISTVFTSAWDVIRGVWNEMIDFINAYMLPVFELYQVTFLIAMRLIQIAAQGVWDFLRFIWNELIDFIRGPLVGAFNWTRDRIVDAWDFVAGRIEWFSDNVIIPVFNAIDWALDHTLIAGFEWARDRVVQAWEAMGAALRWTWDHVIAPIFGFFRNIFEEQVGPAFQWLYNNVIKRTMNALVSVFTNAWNAIAGVIESGVNFFIDAFNSLASGVNKVADLLGIDNRVSHMPSLGLPRFGGGADFSAADDMMSGGWSMPFSGSGGGGQVRLMAAGGVLGAMGGRVAGPRAIVGEGSNIHPEYVIPTDPRYRSQAQGLYTELGRTLWHGDGLGDIFGAGVNMAKEGIQKAGGLLKAGAIKAIWDPIASGSRAMINKIPVEFFRQAGQGVFGMFDSWVRGTDSAYEEAVKRQTGPAPQDGAGSWTVIPPFLSQLGIPYRILSTYRPGAHTRFTGALSWHARNRAIDLSGPSGMINYNPRDLLAINHAIYQGFKPYLKELIYGGPGAKNVFRGQDYNYKQDLMREHVNHVHAALARGGFVVPRRPGGAVLRIGEGAFDEKVQVMPLNGRHDDGGGDTYNFYDSVFEFPNITDPNDAERFLSNLEALAGR